MSQEPKVSIIIPVLHLKRPLNKARFFMPRYTLPDVLRDLHANVSLPHEVIVVCNGQDRELVDFVTANPHIDKYCLNSVNVGVARSWNMGAEMAEGEALCFVNDDVEIGTGAIEELYRNLNSDPLIGEVGPSGGTWEKDGGQYVTAENPVEVDQISGYLFLLKRQVYDQAMGFDVEYSPAGFEEIDMSFAVRKLGFKCVVVPGLPIKHYSHHGVSAQRSEISYLHKKIDSAELHQRNREYFLRKWYGGKDVVSTST